MTKSMKSEIINLAKRLYAEALANDTLKKPGILGIVARGNGQRIAYPASQVTWRDYLPDARRRLLGH